jgi:hemerythrin-like domain-containing protein
MIESNPRRSFLKVAGASALLLACRDERKDAPPAPMASAAAASAADAGDEEEKDDDVSATEDLMREHGVIRRVLVIYRESAIKLRASAATVSADVLQRSAKLMQTFGENYHERQLEEAHIFPAVKTAGGAAAAEIDTLLAQHRRGREISEYVLATTSKKIVGTNATALANALEGFARMYEEHAAREDTIVFPAWKKALSAKELDAMGDLFEDIEHKTFGKDGFDDAVDQITAIEHDFGLDPAALTAAAPPKM